MTDDVLTAFAALPAPAVDIAGACRIARSAFGLDVKAKALDGETDRNFRLVDSSGRHLILKFSNAGERAAVELQNAVLDHIAAVDPDCVVPRIVRSLDGNSLVHVPGTGHAAYCARLLTYVHGQPLRDTALRPEQYRHLGQAIARLDQALATLAPVASGRSIIWDLRTAERARGLLGYVAHAGDRALAAEAMDRFARRCDEMSGLREQVIHHDLNPHNLIASFDRGDAPFGFIDFGDVMFAPLVGELAIAAAYHVSLTGDPLQAIGEIVGGYEAIIPLQDIERDLLPTLISVRLAQSLAVSNWRAAHSPHNREYLLRYGKRTSTSLARLNSLLNGGGRRNPL